MNHTDTQLKQALAKMFPKRLKWQPITSTLCHILRDEYNLQVVLDTELLHLCWLVEEELTSSQHNHYYRTLEDYFQMWVLTTEPEWGNMYSWILHATWQQRVIALAKVKGIDL